MAAPLFRRYLAKGGLKVLESGCGSGRWMAFFEKLGNQAFGVDDSWGPLLLAREHDPDMRLVRSNALATPYADNTFDAALSSYVAEHFQEGPEALFREIHRVLKPRRAVVRRRAVQQHLPPLRREPDADGACGRSGSGAARGSGSPSSATSSRRWRGSCAAPTSTSSRCSRTTTSRRGRRACSATSATSAASSTTRTKPPYEFGPVGRAVAARHPQRRPLVRGRRHLLRRPRPQVNQRIPRRSARSVVLAQGW